MRRLATLIPLAVLVFGACASEEPSAPAPTEEAIVESSVVAELSEWSVLLDPAQGEAGTITFDVKNLGEEEHELVIVAADGREAGDLPTVEDGSVNEDEIEVLTEVEELAPDASDEVSHDLDAGDYILFCNLVHEQDGETEVHYKLGMRTAFTVV
jgi:hypothetical protein